MRCDRISDARDGFSLIELLVVIAVIGVLIGIALPALGGARVTARETVGLSNIRQTAMTFQQYADEQGAYPFVPRTKGLMGDEELIQLTWYPEGTLIATSDAWSIDRLWPGVVQTVAPFEEHFAVWVSPGGDRELPDMFDWTEVEDRDVTDQVSLTYSNSFVGDPKLWREGAARDWSQYRSVRASEVAYPSGKAMLWDAHLAYVPGQLEQRDGHWDRGTPMAFADLHAAVKNPLDASEPVENVLKDRLSVTLHDTAEGVRGVDY